MLNAHPHIGVPNELSYFTSVPDSWIASWQNVPVSVPEFRQAVRDQLFHRYAMEEVGIETEPLLERIVDVAADRNLRTPYRLMLEAYVDAEGKKRWGEKTPTNLFYCDTLCEMFPDARFIHLVRDPRAVVRSANRFPRLPDDTVINASNWHHYMQVGYRRLTQHVPSSQRRTIRYEDLTSTPEASAREICEFINAPFSERMLRFHEESEEYMPSSIDELGGSRKVTRPVYTDKQAKWKDELTDSEIGIIESMCGDFMSVFGYELTDAEIPLSSLLRYQMRRLYTRAKRWQHRHDRFHIIRYHPRLLEG
jgi:hypothetical protein